MVYVKYFKHCIFYSLLTAVYRSSVAPPLVVIKLWSCHHRQFPGILATQNERHVSIPHGMPRAVYPPILQTHINTYMCMDTYILFAIYHLDLFTNCRRNRRNNVSLRLGIILYFMYTPRSIKRKSNSHLACPKNRNVYTLEHVFFLYI